MEAIDIYRTAKILIETRASAALGEAIRKAAELKVGGDEIGSDTWLRISQAILDIQKDRPSDGETVQ